MDLIRNAVRAITVATLVLLVIIIAHAIVIPRFVTARINANEVAAIADSRAVISAEQAYASANGGFFDEITRLCREGPDCRGIGIPSYPDSEPPFLDPELARSSPYVKDGYVHEWIPNGDLLQVPEGSSPTSVLDFCYTSTPESLGRTGVRSFSGTGTGAVYGDYECMYKWVDGAPVPCPVPAWSCGEII